MKKFVEPSIEIDTFAVEDVITTSGNESIGGDGSVGSGGETEW